MSKMHRLVIVGRPNDGKSSIFANFLGDDEVAVSPIPGETKRMQPRQINLGDKNIEIIDTPGLQHPEAVLEKFEEYSRCGRNPAQAFAEDFKDPRYAHDVEIMKALSEADICMLVVNADNYFGHTQQCLLDIFTSLSSRTALIGVLNRTDPSFLPEWREAFASRGIDCFDFDAFKSRFSDCAKLFEQICQSPALRKRGELCETLRALRQNRDKLWQSNIDCAANEILNSLRDIMQKRSHLRLKHFSLSPEEAGELKSELARDISNLARFFKIDILKRFKYSGIRLKSADFKVSEEEICAKSPNIFRRILGELPFVKKPEAMAFAKSDSELPLRFVLESLNYIVSLVSFSYAQSATKEFELNLQKSARSIGGFDSAKLQKYAAKASAGDDSDAFFKLHSELREQLFEALINAAK
ncbi:MAG: hypothetical protein HP060_02080 [Opitutales bacterium]|nr:hypothetical protein [Opitutales bacterium]